MSRRWYIPAALSNGAHGAEEMVVVSGISLRLFCAPAYALEAV